jgi:hypothetical protein
MLFLSSETDFLIFMKDPLYVIVNVSIHKIVDGGDLGAMEITDARLMVSRIHPRIPSHRTFKVNA